MYLKVSVHTCFIHSTSYTKRILTYLATLQVCSDGMCRHTNRKIEVSRQVFEFATIFPKYCGRVSTGYNLFMRSGTRLKSTRHLTAHMHNTQACKCAAMGCVGIQTERSKCPGRFLSLQQYFLSIVAEFQQATTYLCTLEHVLNQSHSTYAPKQNI